MLYACMYTVHRRTLARSLTLLPTFEVAEDFALPAPTASFSPRSRCGTACHRRLRRHRLWDSGYLPHSTQDVSVPDIRL